MNASGRDGQLHEALVDFIKSRLPPLTGFKEIAALNQYKLACRCCIWQKEAPPSSTL